MSQHRIKIFPHPATSSLSNRPSSREISPYNPKVVAEARNQAPVPGNLKGCRDCRWRYGDLCAHQSFGDRRLNLFTGKVERVNLPLWKNMRSEDGPCGTEARLWDKVRPQSNFRTYRTLAGGLTFGAGWLTFQGNPWAILLIFLAFVSIFLSVVKGGSSE